MIDIYKYGDSSTLWGHIIIEIKLLTIDFQLKQLYQFHDILTFDDNNASNESTK